LAAESRPVEASSNSFKRASDLVATLLNRLPGGEEPHTLDVPEPSLPREWPERLPFRKRPKPISRSIAWTPLSDGAPHAPDRPYELFIAQSVLGEVRQHLITATSGEPFGFLMGQVVYCPWSETPYIVVDSVRRETQNLPSASEIDRFRHAWVAATREARHRRGQVIGWYHRHGVLGLRLSEWDLHLQEEFFPDAWHCALVVASTPRGIVGGFIQRSRRARLFRRGLAPFQELVELDAKLIEGRKPSCVDWENYTASESVSVIRAHWPAPATLARAWKGSEDHGTGATLPTPGRSVTTPTGEPYRRELGGRSWTTRSRGAEEKTPIEAAQPLAEEEFADAVGDTPSEIAYDSFEAVDSTDVEAPEGGEPEGLAGAVWGEVTLGHGGPESVEESKPDRDERTTAFELEPPEMDSPGSLEWLLSLIGDTLSGRETADTPKAPEATPSEVVEPTIAPVEPPAAPVEPPAAPVEPPAEAARPSGGPRPTFVTISSDPDSDPEAAIPVVLFADETGWHPNERQRRIAAVLVVFAAAAILVRTFLPGANPAPTPAPAVATPAARNAPPPEFVQFANSYLDRLQAYRAQLVEHRLGRADCAQLTDDILSVAATHRSLATFVSQRPDLADRFKAMDAEFLVARQRFEDSGCESPAGLSDVPPQPRAPLPGN